MSFKDYLKKSLDWYNSQDSRKKTLINVLLIVVMVNLFTTQIYNRQVRLRKALKRDLISLDNRLKELEAKFPDINKEKQELSTYKIQLESLTNQLKNLEKAFPTQARVPQLLAKLIESAQGKVDFISMIPKPSKDKGLYSHLDIEMTVKCLYADFVNYIYRLERLPEILVISDLALDKKTEEGADFMEAKIVFSTLLTEEEIEKPKKAVLKVETTEPVVKKDPFLIDYSKTKEASADMKSAIKLTGIIFRGEKSSAIINNDIYKIGDKISGKVIVEILKDKIVLQDDKDTYILNLDK